MKAEEVREAMALEPGLLELADLLREKFGAKLTWLKTPKLEYGRRVIVPSRGSGMKRRG